jgi:SAP domain
MHTPCQYKIRRRSNAFHGIKSHQQPHLSNVISTTTTTTSYRHYSSILPITTCADTLTRQYIPFTMADYEKMKVPDLKKILQERGLVISGNKADLIARLQEDDKKASGGSARMQHSLKCTYLGLDHTRRIANDLKQLERTRLTGMKMTKPQLPPPQRPSRQEERLKSPIPLRFPIRKSKLPLRRRQT